MEEEQQRREILWGKEILLRREIFLRREIPLLGREILSEREEIPLRHGQKYPGSAH